MSNPHGVIRRTSCVNRQNTLSTTDAMHFQNESYTTKSTTCNQKNDVRSRRGCFRGRNTLKRGNTLLRGGIQVTRGAQERRGGIYSREEE